MVVLNFLRFISTNSTGFFIKHKLDLNNCLVLFIGSLYPWQASYLFRVFDRAGPRTIQNSSGHGDSFSDASTMAWQTLYFRLVTKEWIYFQIVSLVMNIIAVLGIIFVIPESPKYLHAVGKIEECQKNI